MVCRQRRGDDIYGWKYGYRLRACTTGDVWAWKNVFPALVQCACICCTFVITAIKLVSYHISLSKSTNYRPGELSQRC